MWVSKHRIDRFRIDAGACEIALNVAGGRLQIIARSGVDDRGATPGMDQEGVDAGSPRRPEGLLQDLTRFLEVDVSHHVEGAVQIAVADGRDDDVADLAMVDAGNLLCGLRT